MTRHGARSDTKCRAANDDTHQPIDHDCIGPGCNFCLAKRELAAQSTGKPEPEAANTASSGHPSGGGRSAAQVQ